MSKVKCACWTVLVLVCTSARANYVGNDTENFNPTASGLDFVTVESSMVLAPGVLNVGTFINYAKNPLPDAVDPYRGLVSQNSSLTYGDIDIGYGLSRRWELGLIMSAVLQQETNLSVGGAHFSDTGLNEIRADVKWVAFRREPLGLAFLTSLNINEASNNPFIGNGALPTVNMQAAAEFAWEHWLFGANGGFRFRTPGAAIPNAEFSPLHNQVIGSLAVSRYIASADLKVIGEFYGAKDLRAERLVAPTQIASEALVGVKYDLTPTLAGDPGTARKQKIF